MPRLPDIPVESWAADQADLFQKKVEGYFPALEFEAATNDQQDTIPADWPYPGGKDQWEQAAAERAAEEQRQQQALDAKREQDLMDQEAQKQQGLREQAWKMAQGLGIPTPDQIGSVFQSAVGDPPGTGDNTSTTGAFEQGTPPADVGPYPPGPAGGVLDNGQLQIPNDQPNYASGRTVPMQSADDFANYANGQQAQMFGLPASSPETAADRRGQGVLNAIGNFGDATAEAASALPSALWNTVSNQLPTAERTGQVLGDAGSAISSIPDRLGKFGDATAQTASGIGRLVAGDNAATELGAGAEGVKAGAQFVGDVAPEAAQAGYESVRNDSSLVKDDGTPNPLAYVDPMTRGISTLQNAQQAVGSVVGRRAGERLGLTDDPIAEVGGLKVSPLDIASMIGTIVTDPTNLVGGGEAHTLASGAEHAAPLVERLLADGGKTLAADDPLRIASAPSAIWKGLQNAGSAVADHVGSIARDVGGAALDTLKDIPGLDAADRAAGRAVDTGISAGKYVFNKAVEHPDFTATAAGGVLSDATAPADETPEERLARIGAGGLLGMGSIKAAKLPLMEAGAEGFRRGYHGTASAFDYIAQNMLRPNSIYGPGYYIASDSRVADTYAHLESQSAYSRAWRTLDDAKDALSELHLNNAPDEALQAINDKIAEARQALAATDRSDPTRVGHNIRPVEVDDRATLLNIDGAVTQDDWTRVKGALMRIYGDDPDLGVLTQSYMAEPKPPARMTGDKLYSMLENDFGGIEPTLQENQDIGGKYTGPKAYVNDILSEAGFDGVAYKGGPRDGAYDSVTGRSVPHDTIVIFPDKLDTVRNAFTQEPGAGFVPPIGPIAQGTAGAASGAATAEQTQDSNQPTDYGRLAIGAGLGGLAALGIKRMPSRGVWATRLGEGIPKLEGVEPELAGKIETAFNNAVGLYGRGQAEARASRRIALTGQAEKAWQDYEGLRSGVSGGARAAEADAFEAAPKVAEAETQLPTPERTPAPTLSNAEEVPSSGARSAGVVSEDVAFEPEPLPTKLDPKQTFTPDEAGGLIKQLQEYLGAAPKDREWLDRQAVNMLSGKKILGQHVDLLLTKLGERRAVARYGPKEEQGRVFADTFLQKAGLIAPGATEETPAPSSTTAYSSLIPGFGRAAPKNWEAVDNDGKILARFATEQEASDYVDAHPHTAAAYGDVSIPQSEVDRDAGQYVTSEPEQHEGRSVWGTSNRGPYGVYEPGNDTPLFRFDRREAAEAFADDQRYAHPDAQYDVAAAGRVVPRALPESSVEIPPSSGPITVRRAPSDRLDQAADVLGRGVQMGVSGGIGAGVNKEANPDDPNAALKGFAVGALAPAAARAIARRGLEAAGHEVPEAEGALGLFGGGSPRAKRLTNLINGDVKLQSNPVTQMFADPTRAATDERFTEKVHNFWRNKVVAQGTDQLSVLQGFQNDIAREYKKQTGKLMGPEAMAADMKRFNSDRAVDMEVQDHLRPHLQTIDRLGVPQKDLDSYLLSLQNIDIARQQGKVQQVPPGSGFKMNVPNLNRDFPAGQTYSEANADTLDFENKLQSWMTPAEYQEFQGAVQGIHQFGDRILQYAKSGGLIDEQAYKDMRTAYPRYVPTRVLQYLNDDAALGKGKSLSVNSNTIRQLSYGGTDKEVLSPTAALLASAYQTHAAAQKNMVAQSLVDLWATASGWKNHAGFTPPDISNYANLSNSERRIANFAEGLQPVMPSTKVGNEDNQMTVFMNGVKTKFLVDKGLGDLVKYPSPQAIPVISGLMQAFRAGATSRNPVFLTANTALDLASIMIRETARDARSPLDFVNPVTGAFPRVLSEWAKSMGEYVLNPAAWKDIATDTYRGDMAEALRQGGGMSGGMFPSGGIRPQSWGIVRAGPHTVDLSGVQDALGMRKVSDVEQAVENLKRSSAIDIRSPGELLSKIKDLALLKPVESIGERIEMAGRVPAYRLAQKRTAREIAPLQAELAKSQAAVAAGGTPGVGPHAGLRDPAALQQMIDQARGRGNIQATQNFRTTTLDFDKGGNFAKTVNKVIPFFNVGMQSLADVSRAATENPKAYPATALASTILPIIAAEKWNQSDPQMARDYNDIPNYIKDQGLIVMLPTEAPVDKQGNRNPQFFQLRYRQLAPVAMATRELLQRTIYNDPNMSDQDRRSIFDVLESAASQELPINFGSTADAFMAPLPPGISTGAQLAINQDTFRGGKRIQSQFADERASPLSHALSSASQSVLGDYGGTPAQWEFGTRDIGSGFAGAYHGLSEMVAGDPTKQSGGSPYLPEQSTPVAGGLYGRFVKGSIGGGADIAEANTITPSATAILRQNGVRWRPAPASPQVANVPLTRVEYGEMQKNINRATDEAIHRYAADPRWQALPTKDKEDTISSYVSDVREREELAFTRQIPKDERDRRIQREIDAGHITR